jgi:diguanylate cyclase (GGDEF)-like protein
MTENKLFEALLDILPFAAYAVDVETYDVIYANKLMSESMYAPRAQVCWEKLYGQEEVCSWCTVHELRKRDAIYKNDKLITTFFDESTDSWFQSFDEIVRWPDGRDVRYSIAVDISEQKEIQANMIKTHTKLAMQTKQLKEANEKLEYMATKDYLTGINNRRNFFTIGNKILDLNLRNKESVYVAMFDLDKFKQLNDNYGHTTGDIALKEFTKQIELIKDEKDIFGRLGGEEFALIAVSTSKNDMIKKLNKMKDSIQNIIIKKDDKEISFTVSIGLAQRLENESFDELLDLADQQLYSAKTDGRNRIKVRL